MDLEAVSPWILVPILFGVFSLTVVYQLLQHGRRRKAIDSVLAPHRRGDYRAALQAAERLREINCTRDYCFFRGALLTEVGDLGEAEKWLRQSLAQPIVRGARAYEDQQYKLAALANNQLGQVFLAQQLYDEAMTCFDASLCDWPDRGSSHRLIAEALLSQGTNPTEALRLALLAIEEDRNGIPISKDIRVSALSEDLATAAWAVAVASKDGPKVDALVTEAVSLVASQPVSSCALVHYHAGRAYGSLDDMERSAYHFKEAARIDLQGRWGRAARTAGGESV